MALLSLADAKAQLNLTATRDDAELQVYVDAVTAVIERHTGPVITRPVTEVVRGRGMALVLTQTPVVALVSLTPLVAGGPVIGPDDVWVDEATGAVYRVDGARWTGGPWRAAYTAGRGDTVPPTINLAARILIQHLWRTQRPTRGTLAGGGDDMSSADAVPGWGYAIPNRVLQLLEPYKAPPGVA